MKIAIVGLLPDQGRIIQRDFPYMNIRPIAKEHRNELATRTASSDVVILMTKFISHGEQDQIDRQKRILVHGGMSKLRTVLGSLAVEMPAANQPLAALPPPPPQEDDTVSTKPNTKEREALKHAKPGDVITFRRAPKQTLAHFKQSVQLARSYYKLNYGVISEQANAGDGAIDVMVTAVVPKDQVQKHTNKVATPPEAPAAYDGPIVGDTAEAALQAAFTPTPDEYALRAAQDLWVRVYMASVDKLPGAGSASHINAANAAADAFLHRFR